MLSKIVPRGNKNIKVTLGKHKLSVQLGSQVSEAFLALIQNHHQAQTEMETDNETYYCTWMVLFINESYLCHVACFPIPSLHPTPISFFNLPWDFGTMNKTQELGKDYCFSSHLSWGCYERKWNDSLKVQYKNPQLLGHYLGWVFPLGVSTLMGSYRWLTVSEILNPKYCFCFCFFLFWYTVFVEDCLTSFNMSHMFSR